MNTAADEPLDTAIANHGPFKVYNYKLGDSNCSSTTKANKGDNIKRYSRSKLFELRSDTNSRRRPEPNLRGSLQSLGVWKFNTSGQAHQNGNNSGIANEGGTISGNTSGGTHSVSLSSTSHLNVRSQRSPSTREPHAPANSSTNSTSQHNLSHHSLHKTYIDHRSISSSHLMPAFAKRRIAASSISTTNVAGILTQNLPGSGNSSYGPNSPVDTRAQTPTDCKDNLLYTSIGCGSNGSIRPRTKEQLHDYRQRGNSGGPNVSDDLFLSPQRKILAEHDREQNHQSSGRLASPVTLANSRHSHNSGSVAHERRIGSGRLLPRDVSWDYRTAQDREKSQVGNSAIISDKDVLAPNHLTQPRNTGRYTERSHDRGSGAVGGSGYTERRPFDRRSGGVEENMRDKYEHNNSATTTNSHGSGTRRDIIYSSEPSTNQHIPTHNRNRRNHQYSDRNEEPEWFSGGPTSQNDTIELRGFEEIDDHYIGSTSGVTGSIKRSNMSTASLKLSESSSSRASSNLNLSNSKSKEQLHNTMEPEKSTEHGLNTSPTPCKDTLLADSTESHTEETGNILFNNNGDTNNNDNSETLSNNKHNDGALPDFLLERDGGSTKSTNNLRISTKETEFNFDAFLNPNLDPLKHSLMRGDGLNGNANKVIGSSRFSRWFANKTGANDTHPSSGSTNGNSDMTAVISDNNDTKNQTNTLMEFLNQLPAIPDSSISQKGVTIPSVEELEARMRGIDTGNEVSETSITNSDISKSKAQERPLEMDLPIINEQITAGQPQAGEIEAFKKLLEQLGSGNKQQHAQHQQQQHIPPPNLQMNMLMSAQNRSGSMPPMNVLQSGALMAGQQMLMKNDELKKLMQHQQQHQKQLHSVLPPHNINQQKLQQMSPQNVLQNNTDTVALSQTQTQPMHLTMLFANQPQKRLEAQSLYQCVTRGEVPLNFLEQEMNNPNTTSHAKEVIAAVLRETSASNNLNSSASQSHTLTTSTPGNIGLHHQQLHSPVPLGSSSGTIITNSCTLNPGPQNSANGTLQQQQLLQQLPSANVMLTGPSDQRISLPSSHQQNNHQGIPSQRELQFHTQTIMQNAMLKKKLEEQQQQQHHESIRRRQEMQKQQQSTSMLVGLNELDAPQKNLQQVSVASGIQQQATSASQHTHISHTLQQQHPQSRHIHSPTPLAFTPTSVLRKMTAEKDNVNTNATSHPQLQSTSNVVMQQQQNKTMAQAAYMNSQNSQQQQLLQQQQPSLTTQPRMILGGNHTQQQHQMGNNNQQSSQSLTQPSQQQTMQPLRNAIPPMKWPLHLVNQNMSVNKPMGRPILKGPLPPQTNTQPHQAQQMQQLSQMMFAKLDFQQMQQQQRLKNNQTPQHILNQSTQPFSQHSMASQQTPGHSNIMTQLQQQQQLYQQHQQRALVLQRHQQLQLQQQLHQQQAQSPMDSTNRNLCLPSSLASDNNTVTNNAAAAAAAAAVSMINYQRDGGLSPTSNQLAQWFSPELLAQASAGKLPLLNMNQALSLEEFERNIQHSSTAVHN